jgi:hypothetical protein
MMLALLAGCQKKAEAPVVATPPPPKPLTVEVVKESERSRNFVAVNKHLELGGTLYGYVDVEGDVLKLTGGAQAIMQQMAAAQPQMAPFAKQDLAAIAGMLGLTDIKAFGMSSVPDGTGFFRNQMFFYAPGERHGLLLGLGGKPGPFTHLNLAPADAGFYGEAEIDVPVVYRTIKDVVAKVAGEPAGNQMEAALNKAGDAAAFSVLDLIHGLKGHAAMVLRLDPDHTMRVGPAAAPAPSLLICVDGIATVVESALAKSPLFKRTDAGTQHVYELTQPVPVEGLQPVIVADGSTLFVATSRAFLDECRTQKTSLAQSAEFQRAIAAVGAEGNGITYVHPRLFEQLRKIETLNPDLPPQVKSIVAFVTAKMPKIDRPMVAIRTNLPDGILVRAYWDRSFKQELATVAVYNPVSIGLIAAMAIPAFQKVRTSSQEKAVMNNLRQLAAAADQYYLENGVSTTTYDNLVGPTKYVRRITPVVGENYRQLRFAQGQPLRLRMPNGKMIEYAP